MPSNEVAPQSPQEFNARRNDDSYLLSYQYTQSAKARSVNDRIAYALHTESAAYAKSNPPFIYPGPYFTSAVLNKEETIKRGYIRRLTEFYARIQQSNTQADSASTLENMRCNFQFNPSSITRSMQANYDMQFFFNQEPSQLAQPIPGQAGFAFELLFNREAEINSNSYVGPDGKLQKAKEFTGILATNPEFFINNTYDPSWVTEIGVLADIMILDDIVGQGLAKDLLTNIQNKTIDFAKENSTTSTADDGDKADTDATAQWNSGRLSEFSANLGNKAFLTPTPIRILFSPWFMVEGFVMSYNVTFNKFTPQMIPTQAVVAVQMQALYVGFAQEKTFLTDMPELEDTPTSSGPDIPAPGTTERAVYDQTKSGLESYIEKVAHIYGSEEALDILDAFFANPNREYEFNFVGLVSERGQSFYENGAAKEKNGGGLKFTVKGQIRVWWHSYVNNATNARQVTKTNAVTSGSPLYTVGVPPTVGGVDYSIYGTSASPFRATLDEIDVYYEQGKFIVGSEQDDLMIFGKVKQGNELRIKSPSTRVERWGWTVGRPGSAGTSAIWKWDLKKPVPIPFKEDKFNVELELIVTAHRFDDPTYDMQIPQRIVCSLREITADDDRLFDTITLSSTINSTLSGYSNTRSGRVDR